jgi:hypothetical protein
MSVQVHFTSAWAGHRADIFSFSGFFAAANPGAGPIASYGAYVTQYIDNLFMCFSAMTGSGVSTISPSQLQTAQQAFLLVLIILGDIVSD